MSLTQTERRVFDAMTTAEQRAWLDGARWGVQTAGVLSDVAQLTLVKELAKLPEARGDDEGE